MYESVLGLFNQRTAGRVGRKSWLNTWLLTAGLPTTLARNHVQKLVPDLTDYQWYKGYADVIDKLVTKCWQEEAYAETQLRKVTR